MMTFQFMEKKYPGATALDIVRALESEAAEYPHRGQSVRQFLRWSLAALRDRLPPRDLDLSERLEDEALAFSYLCLRDEYGLGKLSVGGANGDGENEKRARRASGRLPGDGR